MSSCWYHDEICSSVVELVLFDAIWLLSRMEDFHKEAAVHVKCLKAAMPLRYVEHMTGGFTAGGLPHVFTQSGYSHACCWLCGGSAALVTAFFKARDGYLQFQVVTPVDKMMCHFLESKHALSVGKGAL